MIFWGPAASLWITHVVATGSVYFGLFSNLKFGTWPDFQKKTRFDPVYFVSCHVVSSFLCRIRVSISNSKIHFASCLCLNIKYTTQKPHRHTLPNLPQSAFNVPGFWPKGTLKQLVPMCSFSSLIYRASFVSWHIHGL